MHYLYKKNCILINKLKLKFKIIYTAQYKEDEILTKGEKIV